MCIVVFTWLNWSRLAPVVTAFTISVGPPQAMAAQAAPGCSPGADACGHEAPVENTQS